MQPKMHSVSGLTITDTYLKLINQLNLFGQEVNGTIELTSVSDEIINPKTRLILDPLRKHSLSYLKRELLWYFGGTFSIEAIKDYASMWSKIADENGNVNSNYGLKLCNYTFDGKSQLEYVIDELQRDPDSRRAIAFTFLPSREYDLMHTTKDYPCTIYLHFLLRNNYLDLMAYMRSNDVIFGWCNDIPFFSVLQEMVSAELGVKMGSLIHNAGSLHIYERHYDRLKTNVLGHYPETEQTVFPEIKKGDFTQIINLQKCDFVDFLKS